MRDSTKMFLASVVPPIASVVILAVKYFRGDITDKNLLIGLSLLASVWMVAGVWGFANWRLRKIRRRKRTRTILDENVKQVRFSRLHPLLRAILLAGCTTPPVLLMLTVLMPPGFASVPYMVFVLIIFVALFVAVAILERSVVINALVTVLFWCSVCVLQVIYPGTAPGRTQRIHDGLLQIAGICAVHLGVQFLINVMTSKRIKISSESVTPKTEGQP